MSVFPPEISCTKSICLPKRHRAWEPGDEVTYEIELHNPTTNPVTVTISDIASPAITDPATEFIYDFPTLGLSGTDTFSETVDLPPGDTYGTVTVTLPTFEVKDGVAKSITNVFVVTFDHNGICHRCEAEADVIILGEKCDLVHQSSLGDAGALERAFFDQTADCAAWLSDWMNCGGSLKDLVPGAPGGPGGPGGPKTIPEAVAIWLCALYNKANPDAPVPVDPGTGEPTLCNCETVSTEAPTEPPTYPTLPAEWYQITIEGDTATITNTYVWDPTTETWIKMPSTGCPCPTVGTEPVTAPPTDTTQVNVHYMKDPDPAGDGSAPPCLVDTQVWCPDTNEWISARDKYEPGCVTRNWSFAPGEFDDIVDVDWDVATSSGCYTHQFASQASAQQYYDMVSATAASSNATLVESFAGLPALTVHSSQIVGVSSVGPLEVRVCLDFNAGPPATDGAGNPIDPTDYDATELGLNTQFATGDDVPGTGVEVSGKLVECTDGQPAEGRILTIIKNADGDPVEAWIDPPTDPSNACHDGSMVPVDMMGAEIADITGLEPDEICGVRYKDACTGELGPVIPQPTFKSFASFNETPNGGADVALGWGNFDQGSVLSGAYPAPTNVAGSAYADLTTASPGDRFVGPTLIITTPAASACASMITARTITMKASTYVAQGGDGRQVTLTATFEVDIFSGLGFFVPIGNVTHDVSNPPGTPNSAGGETIEWAQNLGPTYARYAKGVDEVLYYRTVIQVDPANSADPVFDVPADMGISLFASVTGTSCPEELWFA